MTVIGLVAPDAVVKTSPEVTLTPCRTVTVYDVIGFPSLLSAADGVNATVAWPLPAVVLVMVGAPGTR